MKSYAITFENKHCEAFAQSLSQQFQMPLASMQAAIFDEYAYVLIATDKGLGVQFAFDQPPILIDLLNAKLRYRLENVSSKKEMLARAIGIKPKDKPTILDATAGFAQDSIVLVALGYQVTMIESAIPVYLLLQDALSRAQVDPFMKSLIKRLSYLHADAFHYLPHQKGKFDVIYLDPMFPHRSKSAKVKKNMAVLQSMVAPETNLESLLNLARACAAKKVVLKQPKSASLGVPSYSLTGKINRFDVYLT